MTLTVVPELQEEPRKVCAGCPRELMGRHQKWCSEYCRLWVRRNPGQRQQTVREEGIGFSHSELFDWDKLEPVTSTGQCSVCPNPTLPDRAKRGKFQKYCSPSCRQWSVRHPGERRAKGPDIRVLHMLARYERTHQTEIDEREKYGREVRKIWVSWALEQPNPKPSWLQPWEQLSPEQREVDCRIGIALVRMGRREAQKGEINGKAFPARKPKASKE